jgi:hypothetical protein
MAQTLITATLLNRHTTNLLRPGIALGWAPSALLTEPFSVVDDLRLPVMRSMLMWGLAHLRDFNADCCPS